MNYPKISVITPSFNQGNFLEQTILSVIGQQYPNLEYIIMDGGSTDNSVEVIKKYETKISYWVSKKDKGQSSAINEGFSICSGQILCWINSDDILMPGVLFKIANYFLLNPDIIYYGNCLHFSENDGGLASFGSNVKKISSEYPLKMIDNVIQPSSFWSKTTWLKVGILREDLHYGFDWEWFLRAERSGIVLEPISDCISMYRLHENHKSGSGGKRRQGELISIYAEYSERYLYLYQSLCNEDFDKGKLISRLIKIGLRMLKLDSSYGSLLKIFRMNKYKSYTIGEINNIIVML